jgi:hypothetical protein
MTALRGQMSEVSKTSGIANLLLSFPRALRTSVPKPISDLRLLISDLPVALASKFEFVINLKTAKQIGLTIPVGVLERANQIIK